jgi:hypothetical protein
MYSSYSSFGADFAFATVAAAGAKTICSPLDRIRLGLAVHEHAFHPSYSSYLRMYFREVSRLIRESSITALWKSNVAQVLRFAPVAGLNFALNGTLLRQWSSLETENSSSTARYAFSSFEIVNRPFLMEYRALKPFVCGGLAGVLAASVSHPAFTLDTIAQIDRRSQPASGSYASVLLERKLGTPLAEPIPASTSHADALRQLYRRGHLRILTHDLGSVLIRDALFKSLYFGLFETLLPHAPSHVQASWLGQFALAWAVTKFSLIVVHPVGELRRRAQPGVSTLQLMRSIYAREGLPGFMRGAVSNRALSPALTLVLFSRLCSYLQQNDLIP